MTNLDELYQMILKGKESKYFSKNIDKPYFGLDYNDEEKIIIKNSLFKRLESSNIDILDRKKTVDSILKILNKYYKEFSIDELDILSDVALMECYQAKRYLPEDDKESEYSSRKSYLYRIIDITEINKYIKYIKQSRDLVEPSKELEALDKTRRQKIMNKLNSKVRKIINKNYIIKSLELKDMFYKRSIEAAFSDLNIKRRRLQLGNNTKEKINSYYDLLDYFNKLSEKESLNKLYLDRYKGDISEKYFKNRLKTVNRPTKEMHKLTKLIYEYVTYPLNKEPSMEQILLNYDEDYTDLENELKEYLGDYLKRDLYFCTPDILRPSTNDMSICLTMVDRLDKINSRINNKTLNTIIFNVMETLLSKEYIQIDKIKNNRKVHTNYDKYLNEVHSNNEEITKTYIEYLKHKRYFNQDYQKVGDEEREQNFNRMFEEKQKLDRLMKNEYTYKEDHKVKTL